MAYFGSLADAGRAVAGVIHDGLVPATLEFLDNRCINAVEDFAKLGLDRDAGALLLFGDDGTAESVERSLSLMAATCERTGARGVTMAKDIAESEALLTARRCSLPALARLAPVTMLEDATVPRPRLAEMVDRIDAIAARHNVVVATFGHAGDGNLHPTIVFDPADGDVRHRAEAAFGEVFDTAIEMGGRSPANTGWARPSDPTCSVGSAPTKWPCSAGSRRLSTPPASSTPGSSAHDRGTRALGRRGRVDPDRFRLETSGHLRPGSACCVHLVRLLPTSVSHLRSDQG